MRGLVFVLVLSIAALIAALTVGYAAPSANAHRDGCHSRHSCPSDHATYRWQGMLCVKPTSSTRNASFKRRVRHGGLTYYCKR